MLGAIHIKVDAAHRTQQLKSRKRKGVERKERFIVESRIERKIGYR